MYSNWKKINCLSEQPLLPKMHISFENSDKAHHNIKHPVTCSHEHHGFVKRQKFNG